MSCSAALICSSETLMPARSARCSWMVSSTSRSSTCSRTSCSAGKATFCPQSLGHGLHFVVELALQRRPIVDDRDDTIDRGAVAGVNARGGLCRGRGRERRGADAQAEGGQPTGSQSAGCDLFFEAQRLEEGGENP